MIVVLLATLAGGAEGGDAYGEPVARLRALAPTKPKESVLLGRGLLEKLAAEPDKAAEMSVRLSLGRALILLEEFPAARAELSLCAGLAAELGEPTTRMSCVGALGGAAQRQGDLEEATSAYRRLLDLATEHDTPEMAVRAWNNLGLVHQAQGDYEAAVEAYSQSLFHGEVHLEPIQMARRFSNIATLYNDLEQYENALEYLERSRQAYAATGRGETHFRIIVNTAVAQRGLGRYDLAIKLLEQALALQRAAGEERAVANSLSLLGLVLADLERFDEALVTLREAQAVQARLGLEDGAVVTLANIADVLERQREVEQAIEAATASLEQSTTMGLKGVQRHSMLTLVRAYEALGVQDMALSMLHRADTLGAALRSPRALGDIAALHTRLRVQRIESVLAALQTEQGRRASAVVRYRWLLGAVVALALVFSGVAVGRVRALHAELRQGLHRDTDPGAIWVSCAACQKFRGAEGDWRSIASHLLAEEAVQISHGLCPDCLHRYEIGR